MEDQQIQAKSELSGLNIKDLFFKYIRFLPLFIISVALALTVSYLYLRYSTLVYRASSSMMISDERSSGGNPNDRFDQILADNGRKNIQNEIEFLRSGPLMERVVRNLDLNFTYLAKGNIKELNIYKSAPFVAEAIEIYDSAGFAMELIFDDADSFHFLGETNTVNFGQVFKNSHGVFRLLRRPSVPVNKEYKLIWQPATDVAGGLLGSLVIAPKPGTSILILTMESTNAQLAADVLNMLMQVYGTATVEDKNITTRQTLDFIDSRLGKVSGEVDSITQRKLAFQQANNIINPEQQTADYLSLIKETDNQALQQRIQLSTAEMIEQYVRDQQVAPTPSSLGLSDPVLNELVGNYNKAQVEKRILLENAPPGNVAVQQKDEEIRVLKGKIRENLGNIQAAYQSNISAIERRNSSAFSQVKTLPAKQQIMIEIERALQLKLGVYNFLNEKREESAIKLAATISDTKVITPAYPNTIPVKPERRNTQIFAILVGLLLPALGIFIMEIMNDKVTTRNDIERITSAPILAEVGHSYSNQTLVVTSNSRSVVAEQFRILRSNLQYILHNIEKPVILITSSFSGEGKSFISTNVGAVIALTGKKTIVLEFDIRKPKILSHLQMSKKPGLTNYLLGKVSVEQLPIPVPEQENLFVLACGPVPPNPAEMLLDSRLSDLFDYLRQNFDVVIIDTAPVGMVSDAMTLSKFANATLYIVRQGHTYKRQIGLIDEFHRQGKLPKISLVLNDVKLRAGYGYYGYGRYGYGKGYTSGYFEEDNIDEPGFFGKWFNWMGLSKKNKRKKSKSNIA